MVHGCGWDSSGSGYGPVAGSCEQGNEPLGFIKGEELFLLSYTATKSRPSDFCLFCSPRYFNFYYTTAAAGYDQPHLDMKFSL
jgi:hypothetical protein